MLQDLLYKTAIRSVSGNTNIEVKALQTDSLKVEEGTLFIAVKGSAVDGHDFNESENEKGAK